jgi:hypothetical protein
MFLNVQWTDQEGQHQGVLTNKLEEYPGKPIIFGNGGGSYSTKHLFGIRVQILSSQSQAGQDLVERARAAGYLIGW